MSEKENYRPVGGRRLVLGYDGGCFTCTGLARRIEEQVGGKLEVLSLGDPQMQAWRRKALGENAPWTPTLVEIKDLKVRAWTGPRMAVTLTRQLGLGATWRVMQTLGEVKSVPLPEADIPEMKSRMARSQFLRGTIGVATAVSVLSSGSVLLPSIVSAQSKFSKGTAQQRSKARSIVLNSPRFKRLADQQSKVGARFDFSKADYRFRNNLGVLHVYSAGEKRGLVALFYMDMRKGVVFAHFHQIWVPNTVREGLIRADVLSYTNGRASDSKYRHIVYELLLSEPIALENIQSTSNSPTMREIREAKVFTSDGQKRSVEDLYNTVKQENLQRNQLRTVAISRQSVSACERCREFARKNCEDLSNEACSTVGGTIVGGVGGCTAGAIVTAWTGPGAVVGCKTVGLVGAGVGFIAGTGCMIYNNYNDVVGSGCYGYTNAYSLNGCGDECLAGSGGSRGSGTCDP